jgi:hypothetical protein
VTPTLLDPKFGKARLAPVSEIPVTVKGTIYEGVVTGTMFPNNTCGVRIDGQDKDIPCDYAGGIISALLGLKTSYLPPVKTRVLVLFTGTSVSHIIGMLPDILVDPGQTREITDPDVASYHASNVFKSRNTSSSRMSASQKPPIDLAEGELQLDNLYGVGLTLLRHLASLQAGDLARVECHILDDMVRIISDTFRHHTAFGDVHIYNDGGKLNATRQGTSYDFEAYGLRRPGDAKAKVDAEGNVDLKDGVDGATDDGRWRLSEYIGWLGNFINLFVTDPVNAIGRLAADQFRSGKARIHINNDGSVICQSVADIVLEKVIRIPVPVPVFRPEDPLGNRSGEGLDNNYLKTWQPSNDANLFEMAYQLREYSRWLANNAGLARFHQSTRDFNVPSEEETPAPSPTSDEADQAAVNSGTTNWRLAYSTIRIFRDGSIMTIDAYGNSILSSATGITISSATDLTLQAAGSVNILGGRDVNVLAQNNVGITAVKEKVRIKGETGVWILVTAGHFLVEVLGDFLSLIKSALNVNNVAEIDAAGNFNTLGSATAIQIFASLTDGPFGEQPHMHHLFIGAPAVTPVEEEFTFQETYGAGDLYESPSQQSLRRDEVPSAETWSFAGNAVSGKGAPWPGEAPEESIAPGGTSLNIPSSVVLPSPDPSAMTSRPMSMRTQV